MARGYYWKMHEGSGVEQTESGTMAQRASDESTVRVRHGALVGYLAFLPRPGDSIATGHGAATPRRGLSNVATERTATAAS